MRCLAAPAGESRSAAANSSCAVSCMGRVAAQPPPIDGLNAHQSAMWADWGKKELRQATYELMLRVPVAQRLPVPVDPRVPVPVAPRPMKINGKQ